MIRISIRDKRFNTAAVGLAAAYGQSGGSFTVELRRVRTAMPDVSLGTKSFSCSNTDQTGNYSSGASGRHKFRFPYVAQGSNGGITGNGKVVFP